MMMTLPSHSFYHCPCCSGQVNLPILPQLQPLSISCGGEKKQGHVQICLSCKGIHLCLSKPIMWLVGNLPGVGETWACSMPDGREDMQR